MRAVRTTIELNINKTGDAIEEDQLDELVALIESFLDLSDTDRVVVSEFDDEIIDVG